MTYQKILSAEEDDGKIKVKTSKGISLILKDRDIEAAKNNPSVHWSGRPINTRGQRIMFCSAITHKIIDVSALGGPADKSIEEMAKEAMNMGKSKSVEWKFYGVELSKYKLQEALVDLIPDIEKLDGVGTNFKGWKQVDKPKESGEDNKKEVTIMANFDTNWCEKHMLQAQKAFVAIEKLILSIPDLGTDLNGKWEIKE